MTGHRHSVLLVEDNDDTRDALATLLQQLGGFGVLAAVDGEDALERLRAGARPCVILLDLMMPRKDGVQFRTEQVRDPRLADIPVIVVSGDAAVRDKAERLGAPEYVVKPVNVDRLLSLVGRYCRGH